MLTCSHNIPDSNLTYAWFKDGIKNEENKNKTLVVEKILASKKGAYKCCVNSSCGECASEPFNVNYDSKYWTHLWVWTSDFHSIP